MTFPTYTAEQIMEKKPKEEGGDLFTLNVDFLEGFQNDTIILVIDGEEIYRNDGVTTRKLSNLADSYQIEDINAELDLEIQIPSRDLTEVIRVDLSKPFLYVNLLQGCIKTEFREMPLFLG